LGRPNQIYAAKSFFDNYVTAWNPREHHDTHMAMHQSIEDDPCLLDTKEIFATNPLEDYEQLLNRVQRHTKCNEKTCLRRKGTTLECRYKFPWKVQMESSLYIDEMGQKTYRPTCNDERLNIHNSNILQAWRENVDFQPVLSRYAVLKYIAKYASKAEGRSETYHHMLTRIASTSNIDDPASTAYRRLHSEAIVDRDISAQETFHMLQKLPLVTCSRTFTKLNVGRQIFRRISYDFPNCLSGSTFIDAYLIRPVFLDPSMFV
jgi:hypothetical protein